VDKLLRVHAGSTLVAYDIGCVFKKTAGSSAIGDEIKNRPVRMIVPAFHCYAHNRLCQLDHLPLNVSGAGIEDFETSERFFSFLNQCAGSARHTSTFHRMQIIDMQLQRNDREKYGSLGKVIYSRLSITKTDAVGNT
jgi:Kyakuja-Dileera-Zisupton transposase